MSNADRKNRPPSQKKSVEDERKQHAPSRHGDGEGAGHHHGAHHDGQREGTPPAPSETDWPPAERSPAEEFMPDDEQD